MPRLPFSFGSFLADSFTLPDTEIGQTLHTYLVTTKNFADIGIHFGMFAVARMLTERQRPAPGSLCLGWIDGERYLLRLVSRSAACVLLDDGQDRETFHLSEVNFEAVVMYVTDGSGAVGMFRADPAGIITEVSPEWLEIAGGGQQDWTGEAWAFKLHPADRRRVYHAWNESIKSESAIALSARVSIGGAYRLYTVVAEPRRSARGSVLEWIGFITLFASEGRKSA